MEPLPPSALGQSLPEVTIERYVDPRSVIPWILLRRRAALRNEQLLFQTGIDLKQFMYPVDASRQVAGRWAAENAKLLGPLQYRRNDCDAFTDTQTVEMAMCASHAQVAAILDFEWDAAGVVQRLSRNSNPKREIADDLMRKYLVGPAEAKMLMDVGAAAAIFVTDSTTEAKRSEDVETYMQIARESQSIGDNRTALAARKAASIVTGTAKVQQAADTFTLKDVFRALRELEGPGPLQIDQEEDDD